MQHLHRAQRGMAIRHGDDLVVDLVEHVGQQLAHGRIILDHEYHWVVGACFHCCSNQTLITMFGRSPNCMGHTPRGCIAKAMPEGKSIRLIDKPELSSILGASACASACVSE